MSNETKQTAVEWFMEQIGEKQPNGLYVISTLEDVKNVFQQAKEMEKEEKLKLIKFTSEIFELGKSHFSYALITNEEILELYNETNETNNERNSE
jgi:hypothetical protein